MEFEDTGMGLQAALEKAMADEETRSLDFTSRVTLGAGGMKRDTEGNDKTNGKVKSAYQRGLEQGRQQGGSSNGGVIKKGKGGRGKWASQ